MASDPVSAGFEEKGARPFLFDFETFEAMDAAGLLAGRGLRTELIEGKLIEMSPAGLEHMRVTSRLLVCFANALRSLDIGGLEALTQGTLKIGDHSGPEPDVFIARSVSGKKYSEAPDAVLVIEVAVTTFESDHAMKRPMYARAGIPELWIVEPIKGTIHVHRAPQPDGDWGETFVVTEGEASPLFAPSIRIVLADIFVDL